jgi:copper chaperone NosL
MMMTRLHAPRPRHRTALLVGALVALAAGCSDGPRAIHPGTDLCDHCHMTVSQEAFASQLVTDRGRSYVFDSVECIADFVNQEGVPGGQIRSLWVTDFSAPGTWLRAEDARFLRSLELRSPMGMGLSAHASDEAVRELRSEFGGELLSWDQVRQLVAESPLRGMGHSDAH